jgi:hypothetical protein
MEDSMRENGPAPAFSDKHVQIFNEGIDAGQTDQFVEVCRK